MLLYDLLLALLLLLPRVFAALPRVAIALLAVPILLARVSAALFYVASAPPQKVSCSRYCCLSWSRMCLVGCEKVAHDTKARLCLRLLQGSLERQLSGAQGSRLDCMSVHEHFQYRKRPDRREMLGSREVR